MTDKISLFIVFGAILVALKVVASWLGDRIQ